MAKAMSNLAKSNKIQRTLAAKVTDRMIEAELHRFTTMDDKKLKARIKRIKNPVKLEACRQMAKIAGNFKIVRLARARRNELYNA